MMESIEWEYMILTLFHVENENYRPLHEAGRKHWELVSVTKDSIFLKRPKTHHP